MYSTEKEWLMAKNKKVVLFGMSGLGKTHISNILRQSGEWYHYSIDYRIGTRYMGEHIEDSYKEDAMKSPYLRELLLGDSIHCLLYTSPSPRDTPISRMPSSA